MSDALHFKRPQFRFAVIRADLQINERVRIRELKLLHNPTDGNSAAGIRVRCLRVMSDGRLRTHREKYKKNKNANTKRIFYHVAPPTAIQEFPTSASLRDRRHCLP